MTLLSLYNKVDLSQACTVIDATSFPSRLLCMYFNSHFALLLLHLASSATATHTAMYSVVASGATVPLLYCVWRRSDLHTHTHTQCSCISLPYDQRWRFCWFKIYWVYIINTACHCNTAVNYISSRPVYSSSLTNWYLYSYSYYYYYYYY